MSCRKETQLSENLSQRLGSSLPSFDIQKIYHQLNDLAELNKPKNKSQVLDATATRLRLFLPTNTEYSPIFSEANKKVLANDFELNTNDQTGILSYSRGENFGEEEQYRILFRFDDRGKIQEFDTLKKEETGWQTCPVQIADKKIILAAQAAMFHGLLAEKLVFKRPILTPSPAQSMANYYHAYQQQPVAQNVSPRASINIEK